MNLSITSTLHVFLILFLCLHVLVTNNEYYSLLFIRQMGSTLGGMASERTVDLPESMFPVQNNDLIFGRWEDDIIFDSNVRLI